MSARRLALVPAALAALTVAMLVGVVLAARLPEQSLMALYALALLSGSVAGRVRRLELDTIAALGVALTADRRSR